MFKKGDIGWEEIARLLLVLVFLIAIILIVYLFRDKLVTLLEGIKNVLRFG